MSEMQSRYDSRPFGGEHDNADEAKMATVQIRVRDFMVAHIGQWFTPGEIRSALNLSAETEITARVRDLRKKQNGGWLVECAKRNGCYMYRVMVREMA